MDDFDKMPPDLAEMLRDKLGAETPEIRKAREDFISRDKARVAVAVDKLLLERFGAVPGDVAATTAYPVSVQVLQSPLTNAYEEGMTHVSKTLLESLREGLAEDRMKQRPMPEAAPTV